MASGRRECDNKRVEGLHGQQNGRPFAEMRVISQPVIQRRRFQMQRIGNDETEDGV